MQEERARALREAWGDEPCEHPDYAPLYYLGGNTGDYACTQCGDELTHDQIDLIRRRSQSENC